MRVNVCKDKNRHKIYENYCFVAPDPLSIGSLYWSEHRCNWPVLIGRNETVLEVMNICYSVVTLIEEDDNLLRSCADVGAVTIGGTQSPPVSDCFETLCRCFHLSIQTRRVSRPHRLAHHILVAEGWPFGALTDVIFGVFDLAAVGVGVCEQIEDCYHMIVELVNRLYSDLLQAYRCNRRPAVRSRSQRLRRRPTSTTEQMWLSQPMMVRRS